MVWRQKSCWLNLGDLNIHVARCGHSSQAGSSLQHAEINEKIISEICFAYKGWLLFTSHEFRLVRLWCVCLCVCSHLNEQSGSVKQNCETVNITSTIVTRELSRCLASALCSCSPLPLILFPPTPAHFSIFVFCSFLQERFQVKNPPHTYLQKLRSYLDPAVTRKVSGLAKTCFPVPLAVSALWLFLPLWPLYLLSRISLQLRKNCAHEFWRRQPGN